MCAAPAAEVGLGLSVLAEDPSASAAQVIPHAPVGAHDDRDAVLGFAAACDVVTFDHEHVPQDVLAALLQDGVTLRPGPHALVFAQDKLAMRSRLGELGLPCPRWCRADRLEQVAEFGEQVGWPIVAKTPRGGYDGKGVRVVHSASDLRDWLDRATGEGTGLLLEERVEHLRELAILVARRPSGQVAVWPVAHTVQTDGVCTQVIAPAPGLDADLAGRMQRDGQALATALDVTGVMAVEAFEVRGPEGVPTYLINELAMRPHNSGHWTQDGAVTDQFEQHLRAVLDLPLGDTSPIAPVTVMANVLGGSRDVLTQAYAAVWQADPAARVHLYGKGVRPGRKIGHVTCTGADVKSVWRRATWAAAVLADVDPRPIPAVPAQPATPATAGRQAS